jgi:hypothetical protein
VSIGRVIQKKAIRNCLELLSSDEYFACPANKKSQTIMA